MQGALIVVLACIACGPPKPASPLQGLAVEVSTVEWRTKPSDDGKVEITLVVDGQKHVLGELDGGIETCAIRKADATATELVCGSRNYLVAVISEHELVVSDGHREWQRIAIGPSVAISVAPYAMPN